MKSSRQRENPEQELLSEKKPSLTAGGVIAALLAGIGLGAVIGLIVGLLTRPQPDWNSRSQEWLEEFQQASARVSEQLRRQMSELVQKRHAPTEDYEELPESYV